jgi:MFS family permease
MLNLFRALSAPFLSLIAMMMGSGLFNTFVSVRLEMEGVSNEEIGIVTSALYVGILIGSLQIDRWIARVGHIRAFVSFAGILAGLVMLQAMWINWVYWSMLRLMGGVCTAGVFIVIESWLLMEGGPKRRGIVLSAYLAVFYAALSSGQLLIDVADPLSAIPFCITALFLALSILPITMRKIKEPTLEGKNGRLSLMQLYRISPLGFIGGVISGMLLAAVYGLGPVYAKESGMSISEIGTFMAVLIFGGFSLQWPMGWWADRSDRRKVLNIACFATAALGFVIGIVDHGAPIWLLPLAWLFGGFSFTLYPLSMAYACERVREDQIVAATGGFVLSYGIGAIAGPLVAPVAMQLLGTGGLFYFLSLITLIQGLIGLKRPAPAILE